MVSIEQRVQTLILHHIEEDWFVFKKDWYDANEIGEYICALSNSAALANQKYGYLIWGVNSTTCDLTDTSFTWKDKIMNDQPLEQYLKEGIAPEIDFLFHEIYINSKRLVVLQIPAAIKVPTAFHGIRYFRIGGSNASLAKFPDRLSFLFRILNYGYPSLVNTKSLTQDLSFTVLQSLYAIYQIQADPDTFKTDLGLLMESGMYNMLAQVLSDNSYIPIRAYLYKGKDQSSPLYNVKEFGNQCILVSLKQVLDFGNVLNIPLANEESRFMVREEEDLFSMKAYTEAVFMAFVCNDWTKEKSPSISIYSDRIEILWHGISAASASFTPANSIASFFPGEAAPANNELADIFLQTRAAWDLRDTENPADAGKPGDIGNPENPGDTENAACDISSILQQYGWQAIVLEEDKVIITIPFRQKLHGYKDTSDEEPKSQHVNISVPLETVLSFPATAELEVIDQKILSLLIDNPGMPQKQLADTIGCSLSAIQYHIRHLRQREILTRIGSSRSGVWKIRML